MKALTIPFPRGRSLEIDRLLLVMAAILAVLFAVTPAQGVASLAFMAESLLNVLPFLLGSIAIAAYAKASGAENLIARAFSGHKMAMIVSAALMGALSPFCSCGVIPLIAAMLSMGVPLPAVMAFWLASPLMDPAMFFLTAGVLGFEFAVAKTVVAVGLGLFGGFGLLALLRSGFFEQPLREGVGNGGCGGSTIRNPKAVVWRFWGETARVSAFFENARSNGLFLGKWLAFAYLLESLMLAYVPAEVVVQAVGSGGWLPIVAATFVGIPAYLNGYAALPLVGGLVAQGMVPGAAMAFLVAGGVTSIPAAIAVFALARLPVFLAYLGFAVTGSLMAGMLYNLLA